MKFARVIALTAGSVLTVQGSPSFFNAAPMNPLNRYRDHSFADLSARSSVCLATQDACGTEFCMPSGGTCCDGIQGTYCDRGFDCYSQGCCPRGDVCSGLPTAKCPAGKHLCGTICLPDTSVCCNGGGGGRGEIQWCEHPATCGNNGECVGGPAPTLNALAATAAAAPDGGRADNSQGGKRAPTGAIVGGVLGGLAGLALLSVAIIVLLRRNKQQRDGGYTASFHQIPPHPPESMPSSPMQEQHQEHYPQQSSAHLPNALLD
ncbi:hypothetical protein E4U54_007607 [Claviceps lovelessii]|nr:hypothetical protein E4U54_007607 [Claviceps lovelessii]